ncbi:MAG: ORF6N domain-containing protein [Flavobacteriales bacterium]|nr:ORF6N domain-containing protein [Flavobacteriales bacterium]MCB9447258.1 ORF6N domain-containing protein [Flavobacteriales bacterium]
MSKSLAKHTVPDEVIMSKIHIIRDQKVMLDRDLAELYGVPTGHLNKAVKRNMKRFPPDFMFQLSQEEFKNLMFQNGTSSWGGTRKPPCAFTEQGVAMLSGILNSDRAIGANILIIRTFTRLRLLTLTHKDILLKLEQMENHVARHNKDIRYIFDILKQLLQKPEQPRKEIGYKTGTGKT